jgi:excisionase family DNA binding protein
MVQLLSLDLVADSLAVSKFTVRSWVKQGRLRPVRICRRLLFDPSDVEKFIRESRDEGSRNSSPRLRRGE